MELNGLLRKILLYPEINLVNIVGEESQGVATIDSTTQTTIVDEETTFEEGVLNFAQCMREEGINFPDPAFDIDGNPQFDNLEIENEEEFETAFESCEDILRNALPLELTTVSIQKGDLAKKEEYNGTLRQTDKKILRI